MSFRRNVQESLFLYVVFLLVFLLLFSVEASLMYFSAVARDRLAKRRVVGPILISGPVS